MQKQYTLDFSAMLKNAEMINVLATGCASCC